MVRIAVLDEALARVLGEEEAKDLQVVWSGDDVGGLMVEGVGAAPDVVVLDASRLGPDAPAHVRKVCDALKARVVITTYTFARRADIDALKSAGSNFVLQGPMSVRTLRTFILSLLLEGVMKRTSPSASPSPSASSSPTAEPGVSAEASTITPPRFSRENLLRLREMQSAVACECPNHLADLVERLQSFEQYSKDCENRNDADARVHRSLWFATARARRMMEEALVELAKHEGVLVA